MNSSKEKKAWENTTALLGKQSFKFGPHWSYNFKNDPKRLSFVLSRYKFASKILGKRNSVLELGCSDGIGVSILSEQCSKYTGVDLDKPAIEVAKENFPTEKHHFMYSDFMDKHFGTYDGVVSLDVIEHILPEYETLYFETIIKNLSENGICVVGTPNISSSEHASKASQLGHVNLYSQERLVQIMKKYFHQVLPFGMNDETLHTGFGPMSHYIINIGCHKKVL